MQDEKISPVGWYVGSYLLRFAETGKEKDLDPEDRYVFWENTRIVKAKSLSQAYDKLVKAAQLDTEAYVDEGEVLPVKWVFEGVVDLLPIYESLEDGAEIMYREHTRTKLKNLRKLVRSKAELCS